MKHNKDICRIEQCVCERTQCLGRGVVPKPALNVYLPALNIEQLKILLISAFSWRT